MPPAYLSGRRPDASCCLIPALAGWRPVIAGSGTSRQQAGLTAAVSDHTPAWLKRQHFLYFLPLPHGHGSLRPALALRAGLGGAGAPIAAGLPGEVACFLQAPGLLAHQPQPVGDRVAVAHPADGVPPAQQVFRPLVVLGGALAGRHVTRGPADPAETPGWVGVQPAAIQLVGLAGVPEPEPGLGDGPPPVLDHQLVTVGEPAHDRSPTVILACNFAGSSWPALPSSISRSWLQLYSDWVNGNRASKAAIMVIPAASHRASTSDQASSHLSVAAPPSCASVS